MAKSAPYRDRPVGRRKDLKANGRIVRDTNLDPIQAVQDNLPQGDLYDRLNVELTMLP